MPPTKKADLSSTDERLEGLTTAVNNLEGRVSIPRWIQWLAVIAAVVSVIAVGLNRVESDKKTRDIVATRATGRIRTCASDQAFEINHNKLVQKTADTFSKLLSDAAKTKPAERELILAYAKGIVDDIETTKVRLRDCSTAGIEAFYLTPPPTIACPNGGDKKGFCR